MFESKTLLFQESRGLQNFVLRSVNQRFDGPKIPINVNEVDSFRYPKFCLLLTTGSISSIKLSLQVLTLLRVSLVETSSFLEFD